MAQQKDDKGTPTQQVPVKETQNRRLQQRRRDVGQVARDTARELRRGEYVEKG